MAYAGALIRRFGLSAVLMAGVVLQPIRWLLYTVIVTPILVVPTQIFHSVAMLSLLVAGVLIADQQLPNQWRATGQTAYSAALHGIGPSIGVFGAGVLYEQFGMAAVWWGCVAVNLVGIALLAWALRGPRPAGATGHTPVDPAGP